MKPNIVPGIFWSVFNALRFFSMGCNFIFMLFFLQDFTVINFSPFFLGAKFFSLISTADLLTAVPSSIACFTLHVDPCHWLYSWNKCRRYSGLHSQLGGKQLNSSAVNNTMTFLCTGLSHGPHLSVPISA